MSPEAIALVAAAASGVVALAVARILAGHPRVLGSLGRRFAFISVLIVGQVLVVVVIAGAAMVVSTSSARLLAFVTVVAGLVATFAARQLAAPVMRDVAAIRERLAAVGAGVRDGETQTEGSDELARLAEAVDEMVGQLAAEEAARDRSDRARRDLVAAVSHDLRTPLTSLRLLTDAIADGVADADERDDYLRRMRTHVGALSGLIDDLFELSRLEAGEIRWSIERVELAELVDETVASLRPLAQEKGVHVASEARPTAIVEVDAERVRRVLVNLIQNAIRHTPADGSVTVRMQPGAEEIALEVADSGSGIAPDRRDVVFEPFVGGDDPARSDPGAGLGLAIARAIVEAHGGRIWIADTDPGAGARVRFTLPVAA